MRKLTKILIVILLTIVYYYSCINYPWHRECSHKAEQHNMPEKIQIIYNFVRNSKLEYQAELPGQDYWKAPYETERDGGGDCEDLSIWLMYKLWELGYDAWLVLGRNDYVGHMWLRVRVSDGRFSQYYDVDMTEKFIMPAYEEVRFSRRDWNKLQEVYKRQIEYKGD